MLYKHNVDEFGVIELQNVREWSETYKQDMITVKHFSSDSHWQRHGNRGVLGA